MENVLAVKIITCDYYNAQPIPGLDVTHSEFREIAVKYVPVLRIFGITKNKQKICCNVHNVMPYLFVPCPESNPEKIDSLMKAMAVEIDQRINVSFGQSNSSQQHVYRISLAKGRFFYGYHHNENMLLRIELYNPNLLKRTAGLLQSGCILGRIFQSYESHIPYAMRFFIDFNLFGMSYLHVPLNKVHARLSTSEGAHKKKSVSHLEVDFNAIHIINRTVLSESEETDKAANIGIEFLWEDERRRRESHFSSQDMPELKPAEIEFRPLCTIASSDTFFLCALRDKLKSLFHDKNNCVEAGPSSDNKINKKTFDLKQFLDSSTYGVEFSQSSSEDFEAINESISIEELEKVLLDSEPMDEDQKEILEIQKLLENESSDSDNDSILAPLSQQQFPDSTLKKVQQAVKADFSKSLLINEESNFEEDDDDDYDAFNMTLADMEAEIFGKGDETIPQLDGAIDEPVPSTSAASILSSHDIQESLQNLASFFTASQDSSRNGSEIEADEEMDVSDENEDEKMKSFYNESQFYDFEDLEISSPEESVKIKEEITEDDLSNFKKCVITPKSEPPHPSSVVENLKGYNIPETVNMSAFYSNPADLTEKKEIGNTILDVRSDRLNDFDDFKSVLFDKNQFHLQQNQKISYNLGFAQKNNKVIYDIIDDRRDVVIHPINVPPTNKEAKLWIKSTAAPERESQQIGIEQDSPVKVKREKTIMVLESDEIDPFNDITLLDLDKTLVPETGTPKDYNTVTLIPNSNEKETPSLTEFVEEGKYLSYSARKKRKRKMKQSFSKRFQEIMKAKVVAGKDDLVPNPQNSPLTGTSDSSEDFLQQTADKCSDSTSISPSFFQDANIPLGDSHDSSTINSSFGFKVKLESLHTNDEHIDLTILSMELHVQTKGEFKPNPETDDISAIFYSVEGYYVDGIATFLSGIIVVECDDNLGFFKDDIEVIRVKNEMELLDNFFQKIRLFDPDIFAGYEIELNSWGFLIERGYVLSMNFCNILSRMPLEKEYKPKNTNHDDDQDFDQGDYQTEQKIPGRILLDVWRLMRHEIALTSYTFENIAYHILHRRYPKHSYSYLTKMWQEPLRRWIVLEYYTIRSKTLLEILTQLDLVGRTCELAKLFGIQFFEVLSRGSQFRVESMMLRIAKRRNYVAVSPSVQQRAHQRAPEYVPLILEPESRFYTDPVIVLDFQSLYPSMIIAYNYCFSTCLGRIEHLLKGSSQPFEFGAYQLKVPPERLKFFLDNDLLTVSPAGIAFVKSSVREGVLPRMLKEILDTRLMVKQSMKLYKNNTALQRILHSRQLGLKLIANVTYGYTAANFSGRMPSIEVGDSVVSKGRETLERAINIVEQNKNWNCKVCYGDTDSMFVLVPGRTREEAFRIGSEIADVITNDNPYPVKLKLEKVYQPCILQTKKRYVGNMYESVDQKEPIFEAKGIETIRRDGCPASSKILQKSLKILFETYDISRVKEYVCRQFTKILEGRYSIQDLIIAKEFRGVQGYKEKAVVPALTLTKKFKTTDPRNEPRRGERVPFVLVNGPPNSTLIRLVKTPLEVLNDESLKINSLYYITKSIIPALNRCLLLINANAHDWFAELPKKYQSLSIVNNSTNEYQMARKGTISQFFNTTNCVICEIQCENNLCSDCRKNSQMSTLMLSDKIMEIERRFIAVREVCKACCRRNINFKCISLDCPTLYSLSQVNRDYQQASNLRSILSEII